MAIWVLAPFSVGVTLEQNLRDKKGRAIAQTLLLCSLLGLVLLSAMTGYLGPSHVTDISDETFNRFTVHHMFVLPALLAFCIIAWYWLYRPHTPKMPQYKPLERERRNGPV
jgi:quinol-cytochrome oxidoreductase complex cytochrome b subunit